ncbi:hypothetical protein Cadr_000017993 [Camelus dromedarius]|uniref:Uncharacterized protein n=1 Tax=Camelus dromedarius TaxID=9838 RepID=A0A5N4D7W2_CAMDR|nr:hypothetical protein Cadr_000017993 [Camelus dromedarius]
MLGTHQFRLVVQVSPGLSSGCGVPQHAHSFLCFGQVSTRYHRGRLVINANFEASGAPVHKLDAALGLDGGNGSIDIFGDHITTVQQAASYVFTMVRVTFHHLVGWLKASIGDLCYRKLFLVGFLSRDDRGICGQREVDARIGHQVGLEFCQIDIQGSIKPQGNGDGGYNLTYQPIQVCVGWVLNIEVSMTDVIDSLVVYHEGTIRVLQDGMGGQDRVVGLNYSCGNLGGWVNGELKLGLLAIIDREMFHQQGGEPRTSSPTEAVENQEALKTCALVSQFPNLVRDEVSDLLANGVMTAGIVIGSIFFAFDTLLRVEELTVSASANFINDCGFQVYEHCPGHMLASACLTEEGVEGVVSSLNGLVTWHLAIGLDAVFQAIELPAGIASLGTSLANMDGDALTHSCCFVAAEEMEERRRRGCCFLQRDS